MNGPPPDPQTKALEFVSQANSYTLIATIALLAWVASGVEFSNETLRRILDGLRSPCGRVRVCTLSLIPLVAGSAAAGPIELRCRGPLPDVRAPQRAAQSDHAAAIRVFAGGIIFYVSA